VVVSKKGRPLKTADDARQLLIDAARKKFVSKPYDKVSIRELLGKMEGVEFDDQFLDALVKHNSQLIPFGLFVDEQQHESISGVSDE
jgi:hypothetical protein